MLDTHVHLRDGSQAYKETIGHAFWLCTRLGIRGLIEMPNTSPPLTKRSAILQRLELAERAAQELQELQEQQQEQQEEEQGLNAPYYAMHIGLERSERQIAEAVALQAEFFPHTAGLKMYAGHSTGDMGIVEGSGQQLVYRCLAKENYCGVLVVHCEDEDLVDNSLFCAAEPTSHSRARPAEAEIRSIEQQLRLADELGFQGHLHVAHISTPEGVALVGEAKRQGRNVSCAATPHHLLFSTEEQLKWGEKGHLFKVNPPLRDEPRRKALWQLLLNGEIDWIESDHAPHAVHEKLKPLKETFGNTFEKTLGNTFESTFEKTLGNNFERNSSAAEKRRERGGGILSKIPSGIPSLSGMNLLYWCLKRAGMGAEQLAAISYGKALSTYKLPWNLQNFTPPEVRGLCEADGTPLYGGLDPYMQAYIK